MKAVSDNIIRGLIEESLREVNIDPELLVIKVRKGGRVLIGGEVDSWHEKDLIMQTVTDIDHVEDVIDDMIVLDNGYDDVDDAELYDEDNQCIGTEDPYRAIEDGVPYIPPTTSPFDEFDDRPRHRRSDRAFDMDW